MEREASAVEVEFLNQRFGDLPQPQDVLGAMVESLSETRQQGGYVRCVWRGNCEYCQREDSSWVLMQCVG
jgi:hypothetical protein